MYEPGAVMFWARVKLKREGSLESTRFGAAWDLLPYLPALGRIFYKKYQRRDTDQPVEWVQVINSFDAEAVKKTSDISTGVLLNHRRLRGGARDLRLLRSSLSLSPVFLICWIQIRGSVILNNGYGSGRQFIMGRIRPDPDPTWTFFWQLTK